VRPDRVLHDASSGSVPDHARITRLRIEPLDEGFLATSPDVPGLVAEGRSITETVEIAQGLARKIAESCLEHGDPLPPALAHAVSGGVVEAIVPVEVR
jgi:predicted RNase H-like HicB family nuclease